MMEISPHKFPSKIAIHERKIDGVHRLSEENNLLGLKVVSHFRTLKIILQPFLELRKHEAFRVGLANDFFIVLAHPWIKIRFQIFKGRAVNVAGACKRFFKTSELSVEGDHG